MNDIQYIIDEKGAKRASIIDLDKWADLWEDLYDIITAYQRADEPRESIRIVKKRLVRV